VDVGGGRAVDVGGRDVAGAEPVDRVERVVVGRVRHGDVQRVAAGHRGVVALGAEVVGPGRRGDEGEAGLEVDRRAELYAVGVEQAQDADIVARDRVRILRAAGDAARIVEGVELARGQLDLVHVLVAGRI